MKQRPAYTLLEVLMAMAISVLLLAAVYSAIGYQIRHAQAGRDVIEQATLARSILDRISNDILSVATLSDPARFRTQQQQQQSASGSGGSGMTGGTGGSGTGAAGAAGASTPAASGGASGGVGGASGAAGSASGTAGTTTSTGLNIILPMGVMGDSSSLRLFIGRYPNEVWPANPNDQPPLISDLRRISYWLSSDGKSGGLCRQDIKVVTSVDAQNMSIPTDDTGQYLMAPEVQSLEFSYFDGTNWNDTWDSTMLGPDNVTPVGSPRAISIKIGVPQPGQKDHDSKLKYHRQVVVITTANGITYLANGQANQGGLTTTGPSVLNSTNAPGSATPSGN